MLMCSKKQVGWYVFCLTLLGLSLRIYRLDFQSLWLDEVITFVTANAPFLTILTNPYDMNIPPLYYLTAHLILKIGYQEFFLRLPSVVFGTLTIPLFYLVLRNWWGRSSALIGMLLITVSPFHIWYSQEARPYTLLLLLAALSVWFFQQLMRNDVSHWMKVGFVVSTAMTFYCHTVAIAFIGFLAFYVLLTTPYKLWKGWGALFAAIVLLILPAIYRLLLIPPTGSANSFAPSEPIAAIGYSIWAFGTGYSLGPTLAELHMPNRMDFLWPHVPVIIPLMLLFSTLLVLGAVQLKQRLQAFSFTALWFMIPLGFAILGSAVTVHPFNARYAIISYLPFLAFLASGLVGIKLRWARNMVIGSLILISLVSLGNYYFEERYHREDNRAAAQFLSSHAAPGDLIVVSAAYTVLNLQHYYVGEPVVFVGYPTHRMIEEDAAREANSLGAFFVNPDRTGADLERIIVGRDRFWLFLSRTFHSDAYGSIRRALDAKYRQQFSASWAGAELILYERPRASRQAQ
jgi:mannosyltransferase